MIAQKHTRTKVNLLIRFFKFKVLHMNDSPHRIALGAALGFFIAWMPVIGLHILFVLGLTILLRANKFVALTCVWVSNPFTIFPIYYPNYLLGRTVLNLFRTSEELPNTQVHQLFNDFSSSSGLSGLFRIEFWRGLFEFLWSKNPELWLGSLIMAVLVALTIYFATYFLIVWHRKLRPHRRFSQYQ